MLGRSTSNSPRTCSRPRSPAGRGTGRGRHSPGRRPPGRDRFLSVGADDWAVATGADRGRALLARLYADVAQWGMGRGADAHQLAIPAGDDSTDVWLDLGFARHDCYTILPTDAARGLDSAVAGWTTRRVGPDLLAPHIEDALAEFALGEARAHHAAPV